MARARVLKPTMVLALLALALVATTQATADDWVSLYNGKDFSGWTRFLDPKAKGATPEQVWSVRDGVIVCTGKPAGYLLTEDEYAAPYELQFQWRFPGKPGNSGAFVHVVGENQIWPKGVEAQLMADHAGDFWLVDGFKLKIDDARKDPNSDRHWYRTKDKVEKPLGEWNQYRIVCEADKITLYVNGQEVNVGTDPELTKGRILLQSEGAEIHFRDIKIKQL